MLNGQLTTTMTITFRVMTRTTQPKAEKSKDERRSFSLPFATHHSRSINHSTSCFPTVLLSLHDLYLPNN